MRRRIAGIWRTVMEYSHACFSQNPMTVLGPEPGIAAQHDLAGPAGPAEVPAEFLEEPFHAAGGVRGAFAHPCREDFAGIGPEGEEWVIPADFRVPERGSLLGVPVDLTDRRVDIDHQRPQRIRPGPARPGPAEGFAVDRVELADVAERMGT